MSDLFHVIEIKGHLVFESKYRNFRVALSDHLNNSPEEGIQLLVTDLQGKSTEEVVVQMSLIKMRQHPADNVCTPPTVDQRQALAAAAARKQAPVVTQKQEPVAAQKIATKVKALSKTKKIKPQKITSADSDSCFY
jgi:hypothetical protein